MLSSRSVNNHSLVAAGTLHFPDTMSEAFQSASSLRWADVHVEMRTFGSGHYSVAFHSCAKSPTPYRSPSWLDSTPTSESRQENDESRSFVQPGKALVSLF